MSGDRAGRILIDIPEELPRELVAQFLESCHEDLLHLHGALAACDYDRTRRLGHQMKGNGAPYGFPDLTLLGRAIEQASASGSAIELASQIQLLEAYLALVDIA